MSETEIGNTMRQGKMRQGNGKHHVVHVNEQVTALRNQSSTILLESLHETMVWLQIYFEEGGVVSEFIKSNFPKTEGCPEGMNTPMASGQHLE